MHQTTGTATTVTEAASAYLPVPWTATIRSDKER